MRRYAGLNKLSVLGGRDDAFKCDSNYYKRLYQIYHAIS